MFGFIRRVFRPIASIGSKMGEIFSIGRKARPLGVVSEPVVEGGRFINVMGGGKSDVLTKGGGFVGM
jgi:hypothetical protein